MNWFSAEPAARCGEEMRDDQGLVDLGSQRPHNFHIEIVAEASI